MLAHGVGQGRAAFYRRPHRRQSLLEGRILLVGSHDFQALHQRQSGIDHDRELPEENGNILGLDLSGSKRRQRELLTLLTDCSRRDALAPELSGQRLLVGGVAFARDFLSCCVLTRKCKNWHGWLSSLLLAFKRRTAAPDLVLLIPARSLESATNCGHRFPGVAALAMVPAEARFKRLAPRLIISCNSSGELERVNAKSSAICF